MAVTQALQHTPEDAPTTYCSAEDFDIYMAGVATDDARGVFRSILNDTELNKLLGKYLPIAKLQIDKALGHDFLYHENVDVVADGSGLEALDLSRGGFVPLLGLSALAVDGDDEDLDDYVFYEDGRVVRKNVTVVDGVEIRQSTGLIQFPEDRQNVELTISWGYDSVPYDIEMAAAYRAACLILNPISAAADKAAPGLGGGWQQVRMGDLTVNMGQPNRYVGLRNALDGLYKDIVTKYATVRIGMPKPRAG